MKKCGIYFCLFEGEIIYIGKTTDFNQRIFAHKYCTGLNLDFDNFRFIACAESKLDHYEQRWIHKFKPRENHTHKGRKKYYYYQKKIRPNSKAITKLTYKMKFRVMTEKSIVGFGRFSNNRIEQLITTERIVDVVMMYFGLSHISFCDDLLLKMKITNEWRIQKPGTDKDKGEKFLNDCYSDSMEKRELRNAFRVHRNAKVMLKGEIRNGTADRNRMKNHGHF